MVDAPAVGPLLVEAKEVHLSPLCAVCGDAFPLNGKRKTYGSDFDMVNPRSKMLKRLNSYGIHHGDHDRVGRRNFAESPLCDGELVCRRDTCIYRLESTYMANNRRTRKSTNAIWVGSPMTTTTKDVMVKIRRRQ